MPAQKIESYPCRILLIRCSCQSSGIYGSLKEVINRCCMNWRERSAGSCDLTPCKRCWWLSRRFRGVSGGGRGVCEVLLRREGVCGGDLVGPGVGWSTKLIRAKDCNWGLKKTSVMLNNRWRRFWKYLECILRRNVLEKWMLDMGVEWSKEARMGWFWKGDWTNKLHVWIYRHRNFKNGKY